jgi:hypothetical protein
LASSIGLEIRFGTKIYYSYSDRASVSVDFFEGRGSNGLDDSFVSEIFRLFSNEELAKLS